MSESLEKRIETAITHAERGRLLLAITAGIPANLEEAADHLGCSVGELVELLNDQEFLKTVRAVTKARATLALHSAGMKRIGEIIERGKAGDALEAIQTLGKLSGDLKAGHSLEVKLSFEQLRQKQQVQSGEFAPLANLFEIKGEVIEVEEPEDDADRDN